MNEKIFKGLNKMVTGDKFSDKDTENYIYASMTQPPLKIISRNESDNELDFTVECPTCGNQVNFGTEIFMLSGHHYCIKKNCRERLTHLLGRN